MSDQKLSEDEFTVLKIAAQGQSMIAIGRWEKATKALAEKKYLHANDSVNYVITTAGQAVLDGYEDNEIRGLIEMNNKVANVNMQVRLSIEEAAKQIVIASRAVSEVMSGTIEDNSKKVMLEVTNRTLELLKDGRS